MTTKEMYRIFKYLKDNKYTSQTITYSELAAKIPNCPPQEDFANLCYYTKYLDSPDARYREYALTPLGIEFISNYEANQKQCRISKYALIAAAISAILAAITLLLTLMR